MVVYETERQNGSCHVERGRSEGVKDVRNGYRWVSCFPPGAKVTFGPGMLPRTMQGSMTLLQQLGLC